MASVRLFYCLLLFVAVVSATELTDVVNTEYGPVQGSRVILPDSIGTVDVFLGIPFAAPPIQERRFKWPQPATPWSEVYQAIKEPPACPQQTTLPNDEDCLYLNVFVPHSGKEGKAVMVNIYGGGFTTGDINVYYDGSYLAALNDVIVVNVAYRVGSLGFMSLDNKDMPGNQGMMDQVMGLEWVKNNIANFNGDAKRVSLFGQSAGGSAVGLHLLSPYSSGLFSTAILQSGAPLNAALPKNTGDVRSGVMADALGCGNRSSGETVECLLSLPFSAFIEYQAINPLTVQFQPVFATDFLPQEPKDAFDSGNFEKVPIMAGPTKNEARLFMAVYLSDYLQGNQTQMNSTQFKDSMQRLFFQYPTLENPIGQAGINALLFEFTNWEDIEDKKANIANLDFAFSGAIISCGLQDTADYYAQAGLNVYFYVFNQRYVNHLAPEWMGVVHGDDLPMVFGYPYNPNPPMPYGYTPEDKQLSFEMMRHWANFAKTGDPNINDSGDLTSSKWPVYTKHGRDYKDINFELLFDPQSHKSWNPLVKKCALFDWYIPLVEAQCQ